MLGILLDLVECTFLFRQYKCITGSLAVYFLGLCLQLLNLADVSRVDEFEPLPAALISFSRVKTKNSVNFGVGCRQ